MEFASISPALRPHHFSPRVVSSGAGLEKVSLALNVFETGQVGEVQNRRYVSAEKGQISGKNMGKSMIYLLE